VPLQERNRPGASKRAIERQAALEMEAQARAKAAADAKRAREAGLQDALASSKSGGEIAGVVSGKERRQKERERGLKRRVGL
jgi:beta-lactamase class A